MTHWRMLMLGALVAAPVRAQSAPQSSTHVVSGVVFDSVARTPLAGAVVQVALADAVPRVYTAIADESGHFRVAGLPAGRFAIVFQHDALNALGLESPLRAFELGADTSITVNLAIPSGAVVRAQRCANSAAGAGDGMIAGYVFDARRETTLGGANVEVRWIEVAFQKDGIRQVPRRVIATISDGGTYLACGVASDAPIDIRVTRPGYREIAAQITVPPAGATRQDFRLADSGTVRGTASLTGRVVQDDGSPVSAGRAGIAALALDVPVHDGEFSMTGLPAGTWVVEARAIGYEAQSAMVHVAEHASAAVTIAIVKKAQTLEAVSVVGTPGRDTKILEDLVVRNRTAGGTMFLPGNSWLKAAETPADVLRGARGFSLKSQTLAEARPQGMRGAPCSSKDSLPVRGSKRIVVYLDGLRLGTGLEGLNDAISADQILAMETYPDVVSAPMLWRTNDACAVIAVWTKR